MMKTNSDAAISTDSHYSISGTVRNQYQQPMRGALVRAFDKDIRSEQTLGEASTNEQGFYQILYSREKFAITDQLAADVLLRLYDAEGKLLKETDIHYNAPAELKIDISLSDQPFRGVSEFEQVHATIIPFTGRLPLASVTETAETPDITFLINKTNLPADRVEAMAMAYRFESQTKISAVVFYGLLREGVPGNLTQNLLRNIAAPTYEQQAQQKLDGIMHENIDVLMQALQQAVNDNIIPFSITAEFENIRRQLLEIMPRYAKEHPVTGDVSQLFQQMQISGLSEKDSEQVVQLLAQHQGDLQSFFSAMLSNDPLVGKTDKLQAVFQLNILQEGGRITVDFDAVYNDGHGCAPEGNGPATIANKDTLKFTFTDTSNNSGNGTIKRVSDGVVISIKPTKVADPRCVVFYSDNIHLKPAR